MVDADASLTRLCIKGLPKHATEERLRAVLGPLTDVKIMRTPDGRSRLFGFAGFATHAEAAAALEHWNGAYLDTSKLRVEWARAVGAEDLPRAWSKHTKRKEAAWREAAELAAPPPATTTTTPAATAAPDEEERERRFQEFLALAHPAKKAKAWGNEADGEAAPEPEAELDDLAWLRSKMLAEPAGPLAAARDADGAGAAPEAPTTLVAPDTAKIAETRRLLVRNLAPQCDEGALRAVCAPFGALDEVTLVQGKGYAFVRFANPGHALRAYAALDGTILLGRLLHVVAADERRTPSDERLPDDTSTSSFKRDQQLKRRKTAQQSDSAGLFHALYVDPLAAAAVAAQALGVSKAALLTSERSTRSGASVAVSAALAETLVAGDVRSWLQASGVNVDAGRTGAAPSATVLLVKNLAAGTTQAQMEELFAEHGDVLRLLVVPGGTMALVEYAQEAQARRAYRALAFYNHKGTPLYLQWAPVDVFTGPAPPRASPAAAARAAVAPAAALADEEQQQQAAEDGSTTLFVKNLNFATSQEQLRAQFPECRAATIPQKLGKSLGFGFVEFPSVAACLAALKQHQGMQVDGHALQLSLSNKAATAQAAVGKGAQAKRPKQQQQRAEAAMQDDSPKLLVRNIPFEASKAELQTLFASQGTLKSLRLPLKFDRSHRGFCFVEYSSKGEARKAKEALAATHLYGRHLVLEYARDDSVDDLRDKTGAKFDKRKQ